MVEMGKDERALNWVLERTRESLANPQRFFELLENSEFEAYVSDSAYARGALAPSGRPRRGQVLVVPRASAQVARCLGAEQTRQKNPTTL